MQLMKNHNLNDLILFQYRERYLGACNLWLAQNKIRAKMFQYRERYLGACNKITILAAIDEENSFNTANGIWVHAIGYALPAN